ncbi:hypothetical protein N657DRAFT_640483 [Parathielavia appendiculata]|uniref:Glycine-rich domain-containing protein 1 n=1 Tax=Parathielavia appendiculata TaxID=2587402 RepID=A0AAN6UB72_9PEZI|nr:hypothetical protein N657DRAFT_640483 [Parathielavia appendiculata]
MQKYIPDRESEDLNQPSLASHLTSPESSDSPKRNSDPVDTPPPAYSARAPSDACYAHNAIENQAVSLTAAFEDLVLSDLPVDPSVDTCLAHLKLLFAIQWMKEDVGFADGLWGLWDAQAGPMDPVHRRRPEKVKKEKDEPEPSAEEKLREENLKTLSLIREKRWALFIARAVHRYETWWKSLMDVFPQRPLSEADMEIPGFVMYEGFPTDRKAVFRWREDMLPPLDVLMVWHTHMLNPRAFLEDAMLAGLRDFWNTGMPWRLIDKAIDTDFNYTVSYECKANWTRKTGLAWSNEDDPLTKAVKCPGCSTSMQIPWTTCGLPADHRSKKPLDLKAGNKPPPDLSGHGFGDGDLMHICPGCGVVIRKELLSVAKFVGDFKLLLGPKSRPMPGTVLCPKTGKPTTSATPPLPSAHTFPNRLLKSDWNSVRTKILDLTTFRENKNPTMDDVRKAIEVFLRDPSSVSLINGPFTRTYQLPVESRIAVRKMMSRYWENFSLFALDLCGAVMRQGIFVEKMCRLDWLHSPAARDTMERLLTKYKRFMDIMQASQGQLLVPTLDVDLAWHTHQMSPSKYYCYTVTKLSRFVDHDDKIDEAKLSEQFEWTSKTYQEMYGEVYSECTCWYCETIRSEHISGLGKIFSPKLSKQGKIAESFHTSGAASLRTCAPTPCQPHPNDN